MSSGWLWSILSTIKDEAANSASIEGSSFITRSSRSALQPTPAVPVNEIFAARIGDANSAALFSEQCSPAGELVIPYGIRAYTELEWDCCLFFISGLLYSNQRMLSIQDNSFELLKEVFKKGGSEPPSIGKHRFLRVQLRSWICQQMLRALVGVKGGVRMRRFKRRVEDLPVGPLRKLYYSMVTAVFLTRILLTKNNTAIKRSPFWGV